MTGIRKPASLASLLIGLLALGLVVSAESAHASIFNLGISTPTAADSAAGRVDARYDLQFTTNVANAATQITVTFPAGYTIAGAATIRDTAGNANRITLNGVTNIPVAAVTTNPAARQVTIHLSSATALHTGSNGFRIQTGVTNPGVSGVTGLITVVTNATGEQASGASVNITPGALTALSVTPQSLAIGHTGNVTVAFTTANVLPTNGRIAVTFPAGFVLNSNGQTLVLSTNLSEAVTRSISGQTVLLHLQGGGPGKSAGALVTMTLSNVRNPQVAGTTGTFAISTQTSAGTVIDTGNASGVQIGTAVHPGGPSKVDRVSVCHNGRIITIAAPAAKNAAWRSPGHPQFAKLNRCP
jgi:hypothetical protein